MAKAKSTKKAMPQKGIVNQIRRGVYGPEGYPLDSPLLKKAFRQVQDSVRDSAKEADRLYG